MSKTLRTAALVVGVVSIITATGGFAAIGIGAAGTAASAGVAATGASIAGLSAGALSAIAGSKSTAAPLRKRIA